MRKLSLVILGGVLVLMPFIVSAHGNNYLEFNPDYFKTKSLNVSTAGSLYQIFLPSNEFMGGFDLWFDNAGNSGTASFELRDSGNNLITTKSITIPHINPVSGGQRVHIDLNSQIPVVGNSKYRIRISSNLPQLQIYYSDRIKFLGHNEPHISDYLNGTAEINGEEQQFSFKYALYETTEASAPIISNVAWAVISETQMRLDFNVNEPADYRIEYGLSGQGYTQTIDFNGDYEFCVSGVAVCSSLVLVSSDLTYQYRLTVKDSWGNQSQTTGNFQSGQTQTPAPIPTSTPFVPTPSPTQSPAPTATATPPPPPSTPPPPPDNTPPVISNLRIVSLTEASVEVAWTTNEAANSNLLISTPFFITITGTSDPTMELEHLLKINSGLGPNTSYVATVTSIDLQSNDIRGSISFTTLPPVIPSGSPTPTPQQPIPSNPIIISPSDSGGDSVQWGTPLNGEPSDGYRIDIFDKDGKLVKTINVSVGTNKADTPGLADGEYTVIVYTNNDGVFEKVDKPAQLIAGSSFVGRLLGFWWALIPLVAGLGYMFWHNAKKKSASQTVPPVLP